MEEIPNKPSPENIETEIEHLLDKLYGYTELYDQYEEQWYAVEMQAKTGEDRATAKKDLDDFILFLEENKGK